MKNQRLVVLAFMLTSVLAAPVFASPIISNVSGGNGPYGSYYGSSAGDVVGFSFIADVDLSITSLGVWGDGLVDSGQDGVLNSAHEVGLWSIGGTLLASTTVDNTGTLLDGFYYNAISAVNLLAGDEYVLGAVYRADDNDTYFSSAIFDVYNISMTEGRFPDSGELGFVFPTSASTGNPGRVGPNMIATTVVPEPASILLLGLGLTGLAASRRRRS